MGAHLPFHEDLPTWAMDAGADVCVVSVHKMGAGFEQGSVYHVQGDLVEGRYLAQCADLLMTTSPNVMLYSAMDGWRRQMVEHGHDLLGRALTRAARAREQINGIDGLTVLEDRLLGEEASHDLDRLQVLVDVSDLGVSGYQCTDWLREHCHVDLGMTDHRRILATLSLADDDATVDRLVDALRAVARAAESFPAPHEIRLPSPDELQLESVLSPRDAFFGDIEMVDAGDADGRIAAEQITPYPPGIPQWCGRASRPSGDRLPPQRRRCGHEHPGRLRHLAGEVPGGERTLSGESAGLRLSHSGAGHPLHTDRKGSR